MLETHLFEVYIYNMLMKSVNAAEHLPNLDEMFIIIQMHKMMFNPTKYAFGVFSGKLLGFMVNQQGIKTNLDKIKVIMEMTSLVK